MAAPLAGIALVVAWKEVQAHGGGHATTQLVPSPVPITSAPVRIKDVPIFLDGLGTVQAFNSVEIKAQVTGLLIDLPAREGQEVNKGDVVARIDPASFKASLDAAVAQRSEDEAELQSAQLDLRRFQALAARSYAPVEQVDDQQATVSKEVASIAADEANIEKAQIDLGYCVIRAPFAGRVSLYQLDVGNLVQADSSTGIVSITQDQPIAAVLTLPEDELLQVQNARAKGPVAIEAYDSQGKALLARGTLLTPNNVIDTVAGNHLAQGGVLEHRRALMAWTICEHARADRYPTQGGYDTVAERAAWAGWTLRLSGEARPDSGTNCYRCRLRGQRSVGRHERAFRPRSRCARRPVTTGTRNACQSYQHPETGSALGWPARCGRSLLGCTTFRL